MKTLKKLGKWIGIAFISLIIVITVGLFVFINYKSVLARRKIPDVKEYVRKVENIEIPNDVKIVGLGEGTHGTVEFQELKLDVFQKLVEEEGFQAFAMEVDFGSAISVNEYISGGDGSALEVINNFAYPIYRTKQIADLIEWMRTYNETALQDEKLRFYGIDMQGSDSSADYLVRFCRDKHIPGLEDALELIEKLKNIEEEISEEDLPQFLESLSSIADALNETADTYDTFEDEFSCQMALQAVTVLEQYLTYNGPAFSESYDAYFEYRDQCMEENIGWILEMEEKWGTGHVFLTAHNGHVAKAQEDGLNSLGYLLARDYKDEYYVIGTDFFTANVNINTNSLVSEEYERKNHHFCSADPLAYQAKYQDNGMYFLNFSDVTDENSPVYEKLHSKMMMGSIGEGYLIFWYLFDSYRFEEVPADLYDGMIFVYRGHPIEPLSY